MQIQIHDNIVTRAAMEFDAMPVVMMAHALAQHHGDMAGLNLNTFMRDVCSEFPRCHVMVIQDLKGVIAGFAAGYFTYAFHEGRAGFEIQNLFVKPEHRGRGLGSRLIRSVIEFAAEKDCKRISVGAEAGNISVISFYQAVGFQKGKTAGDVQRFYMEI